MKHVILIGDSIRMGYMETVKNELAGEVNVTWPAENCGHTERILENLNNWVLVPKPDLVHLNSGLHDLKRMPDEREGNFVPIDQYEDNLREIFQQIADSEIPMVWRTTTPVNEAWHAEKKGFERRETDVDSYNAVALKIAAEFDVPVHDMYSSIMEQGRDELLGPDGVHFTEAGKVFQGKEVAAIIRQYL